MREEEEPNWFARWEEELPTPEELMPLTQTLITPDLAIAFDIPNSPTNAPLHPSRRRPPPQFTQDDPPPPPPPPPSHQYDSPDVGAGGGGAPGDEPARTLKRPRLVWTPQLHKRFVDAVAHLGIKNAVPKTIMQLMNVDGLTRENVASHLQKYRLYLKRMQGLPSGAASAGGTVLATDAATEHLFASGPVPHHFHSRGTAVPRVGDGGGCGGGVPDQFVPFVPVAALQQHHQQMAAVAAAAAAHQHQQQQQQQQQHYYHQGHMGHLGSHPGRSFEHEYLARQQQPGVQRAAGTGGAGIVVSTTLTGSYGGDLDPGAPAEVGRRKELTLFPTGDD